MREASLCLPFRLDLTLPCSSAHCSPCAFLSLCVPPPCRIAPTGMIFIPCKNGWSHRPDEYSSPKDIANGAAVLALTMAQLSGGSWGTAADKNEL